MSDPIKMADVLRTMEDGFIREWGLCHFKSGKEHFQLQLQYFIERIVMDANVDKPISYTGAAELYLKEMREKAGGRPAGIDLLLLAVAELEIQNNCIGIYPQEFVSFFFSLKPDLLISS